MTRYGCEPGTLVHGAAHQRQSIEAVSSRR
jgi:hypothetical protein